MDKPKTTPKDFFLWAGAMVALYASVFSLIALIFNYIDYAFPDPLRYLPDPYQSGIAYEMASLVVLVPLFLVLMRLIRNSISADPSRKEIWVRRWALVLTLFVAGATIIVDLIVLLQAFFSGAELGTPFLLKVFIVLLVAGAGFLHFLADMRGYWASFPERAKMVGWGVGALVLISIISGFFIVGTPQAAREYRLDNERVQDLQSIQSQITYYYQQKRVLPASLSQLQDPLIGFAVPSDPETGEPYTYERTGGLSFRLCSTFTHESRSAANVERSLAFPGGKYATDSWEHEAGAQCFERSIDPDFYPPVLTR